MSLTNFRTLKLMGLGTALLATLSLSPFFTGSASADFALCRTDPVVVLSNGAVVDLTTNISDSATDVSQIAYTVYVPQGVTITNTYYTPGALSRVESVQAVTATNDVAPYDSATTVTTGTTGATVSVTSLVAVPSATGLSLRYGSNTGTSPNTIVVHPVAGN